MEHMSACRGVWMDALTEQPLRKADLLHDKDIGQAGRHGLRLWCDEMCWNILFGERLVEHFESERAR